ncbi:hypothetical protein [Nocardioides sp.]|uniref:hypothetical protein n=1 Tax=Nocardioides sp. TaxID=35761 RepID=UPI002733E523|nr:hypothetical protein [Nocardioides sp.]MDP3893060.1 hypothetical protein [Nocardioides sp.]
MSPVDAPDDGPVGRPVGPPVGRTVAAVLAGRPWGARLVEQPLVQPDHRSCGAAVLVLARALTDEGYAELLVTGRHPRTDVTLDGPLVDRFHQEVLALHRRVTGPVDVRGRLQLPWPRVIGTPPWAVAGQLGASYTTRAVLPARRESAYDTILTGLGHQRPVALFVGNRRLPRHVVLTLAGDERRLVVYDPGHGLMAEVPRDSFAGARLRVSGWDVPWFVVTPA